MKIVSLVWILGFLGSISYGKTDCKSIPSSKVVVSHYEARDLRFGYAGLMGVFIPPPSDILYLCIFERALSSEERAIFEVDPWKTPRCVKIVETSWNKDSLKAQAILYKSRINLAVSNSSSVNVCIEAGELIQDVK